jgi:cytoskeletal protein RodZ
MSNLEYNGQVLAKARRELKLKADDVATELCLSVQQVQAIENNLGAFFHSNKLKQAVIKRYCHFLNIDVNSVITKYELDETDSTFQEIKKNNLSKRFKKYFYIFIAAFMTSIAWKLFA